MTCALIGPAARSPLAQRGKAAHHKMLGTLPGGLAITAAVERAASRAVAP